LCLSLLALPVLARGEVPLVEFAKHNDYENLTISPKGDYLATLVPSDDQNALVILRLSDSKLMGKFAPVQGRSVCGYDWVSPKRLVLETCIQDGLLGVPQLTGELVGVDADGGDASYLFGYEAPSDFGSHIEKHREQNSTSGWAQLVEALPGEGHNAVIAVNGWGKDQDTQRTAAYWMDVENGALDKRVESPMLGFSEFLADAAGVVRYSVGEDSHSIQLTFFRKSENDKWTPLNTGSLKNAQIGPYKFSQDGSKVYLDSDEGEDRHCLVEHDLVKDQRRKLSCDDTVDLSAAFFSPNRVPIAAIFQAGYPKVNLLDTDDPMRDKIDAALGNFPGMMVWPVSQTLDGSMVVLLVYSDRDPGTYYLYDTVKMSISPILHRRAHIDPAKMAERRPISFKARDGQELHGYLTLPLGKEAKNLPLVVHPHGGPFMIGDQWAWSAEPEMLASRGYAVLQVNFRGTKGYGKSFEAAGYQSWDKVMIDDITDGAKWVVTQGFADPKKMCIYGASYGGYAALMSAVREPDLYRCVIDFAGVYDLNLLKARADTGATQSGRNYFDEYVAGTPERRSQASPSSQIDKLKAAVMIVHGEQDNRVPISQAKELRQALDQRHHPYEWLVKSGEGHGFYLVDNQVEFYGRMLDFLDKNIGVQADAAGDAIVPPPSAEGAAGAPR
jgi:dipeptidyl aminopeptidase/acylaminoacyl peptidase